MTRTDAASWAALWRELGAAGDPAPWHARLMAAYGESTRHYHNLQHIVECLAELDAARSLAKQPALVAMALWFHDVVYDSRSSRNEEDSADLAAECLRAANVDVESIATVNELILATKSHRAAPDSDAALIIDVDLAILGQPADRFDAYERGVRAEYDWVPESTFRAKRAEILAGFLARPAIYVTEFFRQKYEASARTNLRASLARLQKP